MKKGRAGTLTHNYKRHGVTTLFAALDVLEGEVIGQCMKRHRHQEFIRFLNVIEARVPKKKTIHVIVENYATHKHPDVMAWLEKHRRFVFHFTPTSASWLNASAVIELRHAMHQEPELSNAEKTQERILSAPDTILGSQCGIQAAIKQAAVCRISPKVSALKITPV